MSCLTSTDLIIKHPDDIFNVSMDFTDALNSATIASQTVTSSPDDLTITNISSGSGLVQFTIAGGTAGTNYVITCEITTSDSEVITGLGNLKVRDR